jgi:aminobenzoyl-glutamate utilization protein B
MGSSETITRGHWAAVADDARSLAAELWADPELGLMEHRAAERLRGWLGREGFAVAPAGGTPTAFLASFGSGSPRVGIVLEYDALPGVGNEAVPARAPLGPDVPGHGCGHNMIAAANAGAAIAAARASAELGLDGSIVVVGSPAEEILVGKIAMLHDGVFDAIDVLFSHHAYYENGALARPCLSVVSGEFAFCGRPSYTGSAQPRNPLDAAELFVQTIERLRGHMFPDVSIEHAVRSPVTVMPSNSPEEMRVWVIVRHPDLERANDVYAELRGLAHSAAASVSTSVADAVISSCRGYLPNDTLARVLQSAVELVGPPRWDDSELRFMRELVAACAPGEEFVLDRDSRLIAEGIDLFGEDEGEASWRVPLGRVNYAIPTAVPFHAWPATALFGSSAAWKGAAMCGEALALGTIALFQNPADVERAQAELRSRVPEPRPLPPAPPMRELLADPGRFWAGAWELPATTP